jgi:hypothetical protein
VYGGVGVHEASLGTRLSTKEVNAGSLYTFGAQQHSTFIDMRAISVNSHERE